MLRFASIIYKYLENYPCIVISSIMFKAYVYSVCVVVCFHPISAFAHFVLGLLFYIVCLTKYQD